MNVPQIAQHMAKALTLRAGVTFPSAQSLANSYTTLEEELSAMPDLFDKELTEQEARDALAAVFLLLVERVLSNGTTTVGQR